jgi:hypothetical protein
MSRDFEAETDVKYTGLNGNCLTRKRVWNFDNRIPIACQFAMWKLASGVENCVLQALHF